MCYNTLIIGAIAHLLYVFHISIISESCFSHLHKILDTPNKNSHPKWWLYNEDSFMYCVGGHSSSSGSTSRSCSLMKL